MKKLAALIIAAFISLPLVADAKEMPRAELDKVLDNIFKKQKELLRIKATVFTTKSGGGAHTKATVSSGELKAALPNLLWLEDRGDPAKKLTGDKCSVLIVDGVYAWELYAKFDGDDIRECDRHSLEDAAKEGRGMNLMSFFAGREVSSIAELHEDVNITGVIENDKGKTYHFTLIAKDKKDNKITEMWVRPGAFLPWKVKVTMKTKIMYIGKRPEGKPEFRTKFEVRILKDVKTNLDGLKPFPASTFIFPLAKDVVVLDGKGDEIDRKQLLKDIEEMKVKIKKALSDQK